MYPGAPALLKQPSVPRAGRIGMNVEPRLGRVDVASASHSAPALAASQTVGKSVATPPPARPLGRLPTRPPSLMRLPLPRGAGGCRGTAPAGRKRQGAGSRASSRRLQETFKDATRAPWTA